MATTPLFSHMASALLPIPEGVLLNPSGSTVPAPYKQPQLKPPQAAFKSAENSFDAESRTLAEVLSFDNSRTFISMQKSTTFSVSDIIICNYSTQGFNPQRSLLSFYTQYVENLTRRGPRY